MINTFGHPMGEMEQFNGLTPAQAERLFLLLEELGEAQQAVGKILRHGYPSTSTENVTNRKGLEHELGHVVAAIHMLTAAYDLEQNSINYESQVKLSRVPRYLHHHG